MLGQFAAQPDCTDAYILSAIMFLLEIVMGNGPPAVPLVQLRATIGHCRQSWTLPAREN